MRLRWTPSRCHPLCRFWPRNTTADDRPVIALDWLRRAGFEMSSHATTRRVIWVGLLASVLLLAAAPLAAARSTARAVVFHGYRITVPAGWVVYDLARRPQTCVRFNRHAIYLGTPSAQSAVSSPLGGTHGGDPRDAAAGGRRAGRRRFG